MPISTRVENIIFEFKPHASCDCQEYDPAVKILATVESIQESGWPICPECGFDLEIMPFAEIKDF